MASLPRPLIGLLVATVASFALWYVELRPSSSSTSGGSPSGLGQYQSAINQAHKAVAISGAANARLGAPTSTVAAHATTAPAHTKAAAPARAHTTTSPATSATSAKTAAKPARAAAKSSQNTMASPSVSTVEAALSQHKVLAVLFYNGSADSQAIKQELAGVSTQHGQVVKIAVPLSQLTTFAVITQQVPVVTAPTIVIIDPSSQATSITGYADSLEIQQRIADALAAK
jgi:hypothetical protein